MQSTHASESNRYDSKNYFAFPLDANARVRTVMLLDEEPALARYLYDAIACFGTLALSDVARAIAQPGEDFQVVFRIVFGSHYHLFKETHEIATGPNKSIVRKFTAIPEIGALWVNAANGVISPEDAITLRCEIMHEYTEHALELTGMLIRPTDPRYWKDGTTNPTPECHGAHDMAHLTSTSAAGDPYRHWPAKITGETR